MLRFPTCSEQLPVKLRVFHPKHYLLLAYWIYFRPTALKCYVYQALPDIYAPDGNVGFFRRWRTPAYRNLFIMLSFVCAFLTVLVGALTASLSGWLMHAPVNWREWLDGAGLGVGVGMAIGMAFGMVGRFLGGQALSALVGVTYGVTVGVVGGVSASVAFGVEFATRMDGAITVGSIFSILGGMAFTLHLEIGIALSLAFGIIAAISFGVELLMHKMLGVSLGALIARGMMSAAFVLGAWRLLFYPVEFLLACASVWDTRLHPLHWDELTVLPLPQSQRRLLQRLQQDEPSACAWLKQVGRNIFRRAALRAVLYKYLHTHPQPLRLLYQMLTTPALEEALLVPMQNQHWEQHVSARTVILGELALQAVDATRYPWFHRTVWWLNLRQRRATPLTRFAGMLADLLTQTAAPMPQARCDITAYKETYTGLSAYPDGQEIALSYHTLAIFLAYQQLADLTSAVKVSHHLAQSIFFRDAIRPTVLRSLSWLGAVGAEISASFYAATRQQQLAALARAAGILNDVSGYLTTAVAPPEQYLLQRIILQWQQLILMEIGSLGKTEDL